MASDGRLIVIAAPSGTGKTTVIERFLSTHPNMIHSISCTTRKQRPGEIDGKDYFFIDDLIFQKGIGEEIFVEWAEVHGNFYGTPREPLDFALRIGKNVLLDLDIVGSLNLKRLYGDRAVSIFLEPPTMDELKRRLSNRGTDSLEVQALRLRNAIEEMNHREEFDFRVVNDVLERACKEIEKIIG